MAAIAITMTVIQNYFMGDTGLWARLRGQGCEFYAPIEPLILRRKKDIIPGG
jgi:hypothetical protein